VKQKKVKQKKNEPKKKEIKQPEKKEEKKPMIDLESMFSQDNGNQGTLNSDILTIELKKFPRFLLLNSFNSGGLGIEYQFTRDLSSYGTTQNVIRLYIQNSSTTSIKEIQINNVNTSDGRSIQKFPKITELQSGQMISVDISCEFNGSRNDIKFENKY